MKFDSSIPLLTSIFCSLSLAASVLEVLLEDRELSSVFSSINASSTLTNLFSTVNNFTFLAPTNSVFQQWLSSVESPTKDVIESTLQYHLLQGKFPTPSFTNQSQFVHSYLSNPIYANVTGGQVVELISKDGQAKVVSGNKKTATVLSPLNQICSGGFVQKIDTVLEVPLDIIRAISESNIQNFIAILSAGNFISAADSPLIAKVLKAPSVTYFAPNTPEALASFKANVNGMTELQISAFFAYHVVPGIAAYSSNLKDGMTFKTGQGSNVNITVLDGQTYVNNAKVISSDFLVANGVLHTIDSNLDRFNITTPRSSTNASQSRTGLSAGAKAGVVLGVILGILPLAAIALFLLRRRKRQINGTAPKRIEDVSDTQQPSFRGDQRLVTEPAGLELDRTYSYKSPSSPIKKKLWPQSNAVELDGTGMR